MTEAGGMRYPRPVSEDPTRYMEDPVVAGKSERMGPSEEDVDAQIDAELAAEELESLNIGDQVRGALPFLFLGVLVLGGGYYVWSNR